MKTPIGYSIGFAVPPGTIQPGGKIDIRDIMRSVDVVLSLMPEPRHLPGVRAYRELKGQTTCKPPIKHQLLGWSAGKSMISDADYERIRMHNHVREHLRARSKFERTAPNHPVITPEMVANALARYDRRWENTYNQARRDLSVWPIMWSPSYLDNCARLIADELQCKRII